MSAIQVPAHESGVVRLFAVELPDAEIDGFASKNWSAYDAADDDAEGPPWPLRDALGADYLDDAHVEVIAVGDVAAIGLSTYMTEGLGLAEDEISKDRSRIDTVRGHVVVITSPAFGGLPQTLDPELPLRLVGTFREVAADPVIGTIETPSAQSPQRRDRRAKRSTHVVHARTSPLRTLFIVIMAILLGAGIVLALALGAG